MKPVSIKYYGLISMTKRGYLIATGVAAAFAVLCLAAAWIAGVLPPLSTLWGEGPPLAGPGVSIWFYHHLYQVIVVCLVLEAIDMYTMLRRFAQKEAEQRTWSVRTESDNLNPSR
jgi:hypothetical protein